MSCDSVRIHRTLDLNLGPGPECFGVIDLTLIQGFSVPHDFSVGFSDYVVDGVPFQYIFTISQYVASIPSAWRFCNDLGIEQALSSMPRRLALS